MFIEELPEPVKVGRPAITCTHRNIGIRSLEPHNQTLVIFDIPGVLEADPETGDDVFVAAPGGETRTEFTGAEYREMADSNELYELLLAVIDEGNEIKHRAELQRQAEAQQRARDAEAATAPRVKKTPKARAKAKTPARRKKARARG